MNIPVVTADAGDPVALSNPNSIASIMKRASEQRSQTVADTKYDATPPARIEPYTNIQANIHTNIKDTGASFLLSASILLVIYYLI